VAQKRHRVKNRQTFFKGRNMEQENSDTRDGAYAAPSKDKVPTPPAANPTAHLFLDESCDEHDPNGVYVIGVISTFKPRELNKAWQSFEAGMVKEGWPSGREIKSSTLSSSRHKKWIPEKIRLGRDRYIQQGLFVAGSCEINIDYAYYRKPELPVHLLKNNSNYWYNYLAGRAVLSALSSVHPADVILTVDVRDEDSTAKSFFNGHLTTVLTVEGNYPSNVPIHHFKSDKIAQLRAIDFVCFALRRFLNWGDSSYISIIEHRINSGHKVF